MVIASQEKIYFAKEIIHMKKRFVYVVLVAAMVFLLLNTVVFAQDEAETKSALTSEGFIGVASLSAPEGSFMNTDSSWGK